MRKALLKVSNNTRINIRHRSHLVLSPFLLLGLLEGAVVTYRHMFAQKQQQLLLILLIGNLYVRIPTFSWVWYYANASNSSSKHAASMHSNTAVQQSIRTRHTTLQIEQLVEVLLHNSAYTQATLGRVGRGEQGETRVVISVAFDSLATRDG